MSALLTAAFRVYGWFLRCLETSRTRAVRSREIGHLERGTSDG